ncbi:MAG: ArnT family glycosyltransferase [bacterium]
MTNQLDKTGKDSRAHNHFNLLKEIIVVFIILPILFTPFVNKLEMQKYFGDESYWIRSTKCFKLFFLDNDLYSKQWKNYKIEPVGKYLIGLALYIAGYGDRIDQLSKMRRWHWGKDYKWNVKHGRVPPKKILYVARLTMALFGSFTCLLIYWIGKMLWGIKAGIISSLLLAYNPLMLLCSRRAMTDAPLLFFLTANVILLIYFYRSLPKQKMLITFILALLIGVNSALAAGTKLNGGLAGLICLSFYILILLVKGVHYTFSKDSLARSISEFLGDREIKATLVSLIVSGFVSIIVFVGINPSLYAQPFTGPLNMIEYRMSEIEHQQKYADPKGYAVLIGSFSKKVDYIVRRTLFPGKFVILGNILKMPIDFVLFLLGCTMLLYGEVKYLIQNYQPSCNTIIILWTFITFIGIIIWIPFDWPRYYLPVIPCIVMITGYCIDKIIDKCSLFLKRLYSMVVL